MDNKQSWPIFCPADILIPASADMTRWSVVACDQYTSQPDYWQRVETRVGAAPSTLRLILPEVYLNDGSAEARHQAIAQTMGDYLEGGVFRKLEHAIIYVERWLSGGKLRRGLVGAVDLEGYDYHAGSTTPVRATEGTVLSRIPPRVAVRRNAKLELPHVLMLLDDPEQEIIEHFSAETDQMELLYDFDLMEHGGHISGYLLNDRQQEELCALLNGLKEDTIAKSEGIPQRQLLFAVGDGNHSLASARALYMEEKANAPEGTDLPSRYALVELGNLHDESLEFEAIHRVLFGVKEPEQLLEDLCAFYPDAYLGEGEGHVLRYVTADTEGCVTVPHPAAQLAVGTLQTFLDQWVAAHPECELDYVHGADVTCELGKRPGNMGFLLPAMEKNQLFPTVMFDGVLPRKTFSMGEAQDKRFYLEARGIK